MEKRYCKPCGFCTVNIQIWRAAEEAGPDQRFWVTIARGSHPFPSRTRKLSLSAPMVLHAQVCGRVGSCPIKFKKPRGNSGLSDLDVALNASGPLPLNSQSSESFV